MIDFDVKKYLEGFGDISVDYEIDPKYSIYKTTIDGQEKIFALVLNDSKPLQITLKCDRLLAKKLREEYETVMPADNMNKNYWNKILCTGQIGDEYMKDLINLSYHLIETNA